MSVRKCSTKIFMAAALLQFFVLMPGSGMAQSAASEFRVAGYLPDYRLADYSLDRARSLTDLILFSAEPSADGGINLTRLADTPWKSLQEFKTCHRIRLILCIGGWERSTHFATIATSKSLTDSFVQSVIRLCLDRRLDGIDIDWEHPQNESEQFAYGQLLAALKRGLSEYGLKLSVTVAAWQQLPAAGIEAVDWVNVMAYDHDGPHSTFENAVKDVQTLLNAGVPSSKLTLGLPFYGRDVRNRNNARSYRDLAVQHKLSPTTDEVHSIAFNGPSTIVRKTQYARLHHLAGVMVWELGQDADDPGSLLTAIVNEVRSPSAVPD